MHETDEYVIIQITITRVITGYLRQFIKLNPPIICHIWILEYKGIGNCVGGTNLKLSPYTLIFRIQHFYSTEVKEEPKSCQITTSL